MTDRCYFDSTKDCTCGAETLIASHCLCPNATVPAPVRREMPTFIMTDIEGVSPMRGPLSYEELCQSHLGLQRSIKSAVDALEELREDPLDDETMKALSDIIWTLRHAMNR